MAESDRPLATATQNRVTQNTTGVYSGQIVVDESGIPSEYTPSVTGAVRLSPREPASFSTAAGNVSTNPDEMPVKAAAASQADVRKATQAKPAAPASSSAPAGPSAPTAAAKVAAAMGKPSSVPGAGNIAECWLPLVQKLQKDPNVTPEVVNYFCELPDYSPMPMGAKVKELFTSAFMRKKPAPADPSKPKLPPSRIYRNVVTAANVQKCKDFLTQYQKTFAAVEKKYPVPKEVIVSLLFVETRLGTYIGKENAFWSLACMAAADHPDRVSGGVEGLPITNQHASWLQAKLTDKSDWAYKEMRALLQYCNVQQLDPHSMPGSVYGAIGICQFMPSNLVPYGDDGDGDGVVNLFSAPDAIFSAALYLHKHGWKKDLTVDRQRSVLKRYNNLNIYANTILAMSESISSGVIQTGPPDGVVTAGSKKAKKSKKAAAPKKPAARKKASSNGKTRASR